MYSKAVKSSHAGDHTKHSQYSKGQYPPEFNAQLSDILHELWELDDNRLEAGKHYAIDLQGYTKSYRRQDWAKDPLFQFVHDEVLKRPTYKRFIALLDNYEASTGRSEVVTAEEVQENRSFIDAIMETRVMKRAHEFLASCGKTSHNVVEFKKHLDEIWFKLYRRTKGSKALDSSGFEHVFVGETRNKEPMGFHNWIQFYLQEKAGKVDYQGYIQGTKPPGGNDAHLITIQFTWNEGCKPAGSSFIGTSPEFEIGLYTIIYLCGQTGENIVRFGGQNVIIIMHKHGNNLGSAYPKHHR